MTFIVASDLHLSDRPADAYRFDIFKILARYEGEVIYILGDITDSKDRHSSKLVNRVVSSLVELSRVAHIYILMGNHDYTDPKNPFFNFLNNLDGISLITKPHRVIEDNVLMLPHTKDVGTWKDSPFHSDGDFVDYIMIHQTVEGAISETGARLTGVNVSELDKWRPKFILSGDIHKPQKVGKVLYVGAPYNIRFGDNFEPRFLIVRKGKIESVATDFPRKWSLTVREADDIVRNSSLLERDQVKITMELTREELVDWPLHKQEVLAACAERSLEVFGIELKAQVRRRLKTNSAEVSTTRTPKEIFVDYCKQEKVSKEQRDVGLRLLNADV